MIWIIFSSFIVLMFIGVPVGFSMITSSLFYIVLTGQNVFVIVQRMVNSLNSFPLLAIPGFILVGNLMNSSGLTNKIFRFARDLVGHMHGGLAQVNIILSLIFSGTSGAALADIGGIGAMEMKAMTEAGYDKEFSASITIASATVGPIFPPSIPLVMYGALAEASIVGLLLGGIFPAFIFVILMMITTTIISRIKKYPRDSKRASLKKIARSFFQSLPAILTPIVLILGLVSGVFSPTEAAAVTIIYIILILFFVYKDITLRGFFNACKESVSTTSAILINVAGAALLGYIAAIEQLPQAITGYLLNYAQSPITALLILNGILLIAGCFLETIAALLLFTPIFVPVYQQLGFDPIHIGMVMVFNLMIGLLTPPMGMSLYMVSNIVGEKMERILKSLLPFYIPLFLTLLLITFVPSMVLFIPNLIG